MREEYVGWQQEPRAKIGGERGVKPQAIQWQNRSQQDISPFHKQEKNVGQRNVRARPWFRTLRVRGCGCGRLHEPVYAFANDGETRQGRTVMSCQTLPSTYGSFAR